VSTAEYLWVAGFHLLLGAFCGWQFRSILLVYKTCRLQDEAMAKYDADIQRLTAKLADNKRTAEDVDKQMEKEIRAAWVLFLKQNKP